MRKYLYILVVFIGCVQIIGHVIGVKEVKAFGMLTSSSPLPIVFTEVKGVETFASDFYIEYLDENNKQVSKQITPEMYAKLKGPYNRRNVYGAAISYGPILDKKILNPVLEYGICKKVLLKPISNTCTSPKCAAFSATIKQSFND
mgnify:CR=1 FL=1